ncbi:hypothetical protein [Paenibacillus faecalis]|uniref:hypothetical protein n=1 Tax=Paenibacillus faecalis TaxID=2079532 RepID=UPI000D10B764|nr:hypothetical protein [Paenibacillus faecalis]
MKLMKWLLKISLTAVLVSTLTILTTGIVVNAYLQSVLASFNIQLEAQPLGFGGIMKNLLGFNHSSQQEDKDTASDEAGETIKNDSENNDASTGSSDTEKDNMSPENRVGAQDSDSKKQDSEAGGASRDRDDNRDDQTAEENAPPEDSLPVMGRDLSESVTDQGDQQVVMTPDDMVSRKSSLTTKEKEEIFTIFMNKLPQAEMQKISEAMEDGLTAAELEEIESGISEYLSEEEFKKLMTMLKE